MRSALAPVAVNATPERVKVIVVPSSVSIVHLALPWCRLIDNDYHGGEWYTRVYTASIPFA
jgi:hypothetical protein